MQEDATQFHAADNPISSFPVIQNVLCSHANPPDPSPLPSPASITGNPDYVYKTPRSQEKNLDAIERP
jgi:hypothetical protein